MTVETGIFIVYYIVGSWTLISAEYLCKNDTANGGKKPTNYYLLFYGGSKVSLNIIFLTV